MRFPSGALQRVLTATTSLPVHLQAAVRVRRGPLLQDQAAHLVAQLTIASKSRKVDSQQSGGWVSWDIGAAGVHLLVVDNLLLCGSDNSNAIMSRSENRT
jgi:hypothetical protein